MVYIFYSHHHYHHYHHYHYNNVNIKGLSQHPQAEILYKEAYEGQVKEAGGHDNHISLETMINIASAVSNQGRKEEARVILVMKNLLKFVVKTI